MSRFIEITTISGDQYWLNVDYIVGLRPSNGQHEIDASAVLIVRDMADGLAPLVLEVGPLEVFRLREVLRPS